MCESGCRELYLTDPVMDAKKCGGIVRSNPLNLHLKAALKALPLFYLPS